MLRHDSMRAVVAFYSNPRVPPQLVQHLGLFPLTKLTREMRHILRTLSPFDATIEPCASLKDVRTRVTQMRPRVVLFSGHSVHGTLLLENPSTGLATAPTPSELCLAFAHPALRIVVLLGCSTTEVLSKVLREGQTGIGFSTIVDDSAAMTFATGLVRELARQVRTKRFDATKLYEAGRRTWVKRGFVEADPRSGVGHGVPALVVA